MTTPIRWRVGEPAVRAAVERWHAAERAGGPAGQVLHDNPRRRLIVWADPELGALVLKQFRSASGRHVRRERWKARLGRSPAAREWGALAALHAAKVAVPEPLGLARLPDGDALLVLHFVEADALADALKPAGAPRRALLADLGRVVARLHGAGFVHGDLQHGNVLVGEQGAVLLDLQHARRSRSARGRRADLARLDHSLWARLPLADRVRLRAAALGLERPFAPGARAALRAVGAAAEARADAHARGRTRRALRSGRLYARLRLGSARGMRLRELPAALAADALTGHRAALAAGDERVLKHDERSRISGVEVGGRRVIVKQVLPRGALRRLADALRGSPARRAWLGGHGLRARGIGTALPLAFVETRRFGVPTGSAVVLEDLRPAPDALHAGPRDPQGVADALGRLLVALHRRGVDHGDLKAAHVFLVREGEGWTPRLIDLEGVRFRRRLTPARRLAALAQLNASLPDGVPADARRRAFARYAAACPFAGGSAAALGDVVARSLARRHHWSGAGCRLAPPPDRATL